MNDLLHYWEWEKRVSRRAWRDTLDGIRRVSLLWEIGLVVGPPAAWRVLQYLMGGRQSRGDFLVGAAVGLVAWLVFVFVVYLSWHYMRTPFKLLRELEQRLPKHELDLDFNAAYVGIERVPSPRHGLDWFVATAYGVKITKRPEPAGTVSLDASLFLIGDRVLEEDSRVHPAVWCPEDGWADLTRPGDRLPTPVDLTDERPTVAGLLSFPIDPITMDTLGSLDNMDGATTTIRFRDRVRNKLFEATVEVYRADRATLTEATDLFLP